MRPEALSRVQVFSPGMLDVHLEIDGGATGFSGFVQYYTQHCPAEALVSLVGQDVEFLEPGRLASMLERPGE